MKTREESRKTMTSLRPLCRCALAKALAVNFLVLVSVQGALTSVTFENDLDSVLNREKFIRDHEKRSETYLNSVLENKNNIQENDVQNKLNDLENSVENVQSVENDLKTVQNQVNRLENSLKPEKARQNILETDQNLQGESSAVTKDLNELLSKDDELKLLSKQVRVLLERRTEDLRSIEENVRKIVFKGPEVEELRDQLRSLRLELEQLRTGSTPLPTSKNEQITTKWLSAAISELKTEISELQLALNSSTILQRHEAVESKMKLFESDVKNLNFELEKSKKKEAKYEAEMTVLKEEFGVLRREWKKSAVESGEVKNLIKSLQQEWINAQAAMLEKPALLPPLEDKNMPKTNRHQRVLRTHLMFLQKGSRTLHKENYLLKNRVSKLETELEGLKNEVKSQQDNKDEAKFDRINGNEIQNFISTNQIKEIKSTFEETLQKEILNVTMEQEKISKDIENITKQMVNSEKLHFSMLELLEDVEQLEFKVENTEPSLRKEISKVETQSNQNIADLAEIRENQKNIIESIKAISYSVSELQEKSVEEKEKLAKFKEHLAVLEKADGVQNSKLHNHILKEESSTINVNATKSTIHLVEELKSFESEYKSIVNKLPRDCSSVSGQKGVYLISPGDAEPILTQCDDGWTTVQKRYDGSLNFNRNWNDYSNGFGSATGEHWLGNRNLHHLTKENCSRLQINMKDIYGKYWQVTYDDFRVADYTNGFRIYVGGYSGNSSDAMNYQNNMEFSTVDNDRDISNTHCASNYEGGWWFSHCQHANLNGRYNLGLTWFDSSRNEWIAVSQSEMRVKRRDVC